MALEEKLEVPVGTLQINRWHYTHSVYPYNTAAEEAEEVHAMQSLR